MPRLRLVPASLILPLLAPAMLVMAASLTGCDSGADASLGGSVTPTGCKPATGSVPPIAPNGYYVNGNTLCTPQGTPHLLHGVDRPSLEWDADGVNLSAADFALMATWRANAVRIALNQDFWLPESPSHSAGYPALVDQTVQWAEQAGMDVILDLHWSDQGDYSVTPGQQTMADAHSLLFWQALAARYKGDGRIFFELYNEPHDVTPEVWLSGGQAGFTVVGMQQLYDAVRAEGANNAVIIGGLDWAFDLSQVGGTVKGTNILYATHPYNTSDRQPSTWYQSFGALAATSPVIATEFGDGTGSCSSAWDTQLIAYADMANMSWTAWAWFDGGCTFPSLITDWQGDTNAPGAVVKAALLGYHDPTPPSPGRDGEGGPDDAGDDATPGDAGADGPDDAGADASG